MSMFFLSSSSGGWWNDLDRSNRLHWCWIYYELWAILQSEQSVSKDYYLVSRVVCLPAGHRNARSPQSVNWWTEVPVSRLLSRRPALLYKHLAVLCWPPSDVTGPSRRRTCWTEMPVWFAENRPRQQQLCPPLIFSTTHARQAMTSRPISVHLVDVCCTPIDNNITINKQCRPIRQPIWRAQLNSMEGRQEQEQDQSVPEVSTFLNTQKAY